MPLTAEQIETYRRDGVVPVGRVLTDAQLAEARERVEAMVTKELVDRPSSTAGKHGIRRLDVSKFDDWFASIVRSAPVLDAGEAALGPDIQYYQDNLFYKPAGVGDQTPWHQDNIWWHADPPIMLTIWIALDDVDDSNGGVRYVRGSHSHLIEHTLPFSDPKGFTYNLLDPAKLDVSKAVSFKVPAGHAVMHHCLTAHSAPFNTSNRPRRGYTVSLAQAGLFQDLERFPLLRGRMPAGV